MASNGDVIDFCQKRERLLKTKRDTADERAECADAVRTIGNLLKDSMLRSQVNCVHLPHADSYVRVVPQQRRSLRIKTVEDIIGLLDSISTDCQDTPVEKLPDALARAVAERARERGGVAPPRVQMTRRVGVRERVIEAHEAGREVGTLAAQWQTHVRERASLQERVRPLQKEVRESEKKITDAVSESSAPTLVQMRPRSSDEAPSEPPKILQVSHKTVPRRRNIFGIRQVCGYVREAAGCIGARDEGYESRLKGEVRRVVREAQAQPIEYTTKLSVRNRRPVV